MMGINRERCDHCGKWQIYSELVMPHTKEEYQDGEFGVCPKCVNNSSHSEEYWNKWYEKKIAKYT